MADQLENNNGTLSSSFKSINNDVIEEIDCLGLKAICEGSTIIRSNVNVLILKNCTSLSLIVSHSEFLQNSTIFVIIVCMSGTYDDDELGQLCDKIAKPRILQIKKSGLTRLFFVNTEKRIEEVEINGSWNAFSSAHFNFNFVCNLLHSEPEKFGKFGFDSIEMKIDTNACFKGKRLIDLAIEHGDILVLQFLLLFQHDITVLNDDKERVLEIAVEKGSLEVLKAVLEIPVNTENFEAFLSPEKRQALSLMSDKNLSLLMLSARSGKTDVIRFLLSCGLDVNLENDDEDTASDFAWRNGHNHSLIALLEADSPFPSEYDWDEEPEGTELDQISKERNTLHKQIKDNQIEEIKKFVEMNPKLKCAYDQRNQCALVTALESKNFEVYSFLRSNGYTHGIDGDHEKMLSELKSSEKEDLKFSNRKYFPANMDSHIMDLLSRSRLGFGSEQKNFEKIQKHFEALDAIAKIQPILKIISLARKLDIVLDFNQTTIGDMDPNFNHAVVKARTIFDNGNILIGAKSSDAEVMALMAHEFTHYAVYLLYENEGLPYYADDESLKQEFLGIVDIYEAMQSENHVIKDVFAYPRNKFAVELIVRVPHLLALHSQEPDKVSQLGKDFKELFNFFIKRVLPAIKHEIPVMKTKQQIRDLNSLLDVKKKSEASRLFCDNIEFDEIIGKSDNFLIQSATPSLVLCNLLNTFKTNGTRNVDSLHIFLKLEQLMDPERHDMIREAMESVIKPKLFVLETGNATEFAKIKDLLNDEILSSKVVLIVKAIFTKKTDEENFKKVFPNQQQIEYNWSDLNETSQAKVLSSKVFFQGLEMLLSDVLKIDSKILKELSLEEVLKLSEIKLKTFNESVPPSPEVYIKRTFKNISSDDPLTSEHVIDLLVSERSLILADNSGMGKTTSALLFSRKLKQRNPLSWVVYIDLKLHTNHFYRDDEVSTDDITSDFFSAKILKLETRLEMKFFEHFYENEKVIFIIDGFDEISPVYKNCILKLIETIQESKNLLLVTTRTHLTMALVKSVPSKILKLQSFTVDDQVEFLVKFWSRTKERPVNKLETKARSLLEQFQETLTQEDFFGVPLQVRMLAEIYEKSDPNQIEIRELNIFTLYQSFVKKKIDVWIERGPLAKEDNTNLQTSSSSINQIHQKLAVENFFIEDLTKALKLPKIKEPLTDELLARIGLLQAEGSGKFLFTHQSFSEYFVADFVLSNVTEETLRTEFEELHQMFMEILDDERFEKVRSFMNGKLKKEEDLDVDVLSAKLEKSLRVEPNRRFFQNFVKENLSALITFMLTTVKLSVASKVSLIKRKNEHSEDSLHFSARFSDSSSFKQLWRCIESFIAADERIELLFSTGFHERNVFNRAILDENNEVLKEILQIASNLMDPSTFKKYLMQEDTFRSNTLNISSSGYPTAFDMVWEAVESKLSAEDQKDLLFWQEYSRRNVLLNAVQDKCHEVIKSIVKIAKKLFNYEEMQKFLFLEDSNRDTALHCAAYHGDLEVFTIIWSFIKDVLNRIDQKMLWQKQLDPNIFMRSIECVSFRKTIAKEVLSASKEILNAKETREALAEKSFLNTSFISLATDNRLVDRIFDPKDIEWVKEEYEAHLRSFPMGLDGNHERSPIVRDLRDALKEDLSAEELKAALYAEPEAGDTTLQFALEYGSTFLADRMFELAEMRLSTSERIKLIQTTSPSGKTILSRSEMNGISGVMDSVCSFLVRQSDLVSEVKALFFMQDNCGLDFFTYAAYFKRRCLLVVLDWFKVNFNYDDLRQLFFERNSTWMILAHEVAEYCDGDLSKKFFDFCLSSFERPELNEMILIRFYDNHNTLERSLFNPNRTVVSEVWNFYDQILDKKELEELLFKNNQGRVYFKNDEGKNPDAIETLKTVVIKLYGEDKTRQLFR